jgi:hypothetical protein
MDEKGAGAILIGAVVVCYVLLLEVISHVVPRRFAGAHAPRRAR